MIWAGILFIGHDLEVLNFDIPIPISLTEEFLKLNLIGSPLTSLIFDNTWLILVFSINLFDF